MKKKYSSDPFQVTLLVLCAVLFFLVFFVLSGGVRFLYSFFNSSPARSYEFILPLSEHSAMTPFDFDSSKDSYTGSILHSPFAGADDIREELFLRKLYTYSTNSSLSHMQGACTDGTYLWFGWETPRMIMKMHILTRKVTAVSYDESSWVYGHINDMTYNPKTNELLISAYYPGNPSTFGNLAILDADTLNLKQMISVQKNDRVLAFSGIAYDRLHDCYILASAGNNYDFLDSSFQWYDSVHVTRYEDDTLQGIETDGRYIYRCLWRESEKNLISVYDLSGSFVRFTEIPISGYDTELQDLMYDWEGNWYINTADYDRITELAGCSLYYVGMQSSADYNEVDRFFSFLETALPQ